MVTTVSPDQVKDERSGQSYFTVSIAVPRPEATKLRQGADPRPARRSPDPRRHAAGDHLSDPTADGPDRPRLPREVTLGFLIRRRRGRRRMSGFSAPKRRVREVCHGRASTATFDYWLSLSVIAFLAKHLITDFFLQTSWMALGKTQTTGWVLPLSVHAGIHAIGTLLICLALAPALSWFAAADFIVHFLLDRAEGLRRRGAGRRRRKSRSSGGCWGPTKVSTRSRISSSPCGSPPRIPDVRGHLRR